MSKYLPLSADADLDDLIAALRQAFGKIAERADTSEEQTTP